MGKGGEMTMPTSPSLSKHRSTQTKKSCPNRFPKHKEMKDGQKIGLFYSRRKRRREENYPFFFFHLGLPVFSLLLWLGQKILFITINKAGRESAVCSRGLTPNLEKEKEAIWGAKR